MPHIEPPHTSIRMAPLDAQTVCVAVAALGDGPHGVAAIRRKMLEGSAQKQTGEWNDTMITLLRDAVEAGALTQRGSWATFLCAFEATGAVAPASAPPGKKKKKKAPAAKRKKPPAAEQEDDSDGDSSAAPLVAPPPAKKAKKAKEAKKAKPAKARAKKSKNAPPPSTAEDAPAAAAAASAAATPTASFTPRWYWAGDKPGGMQDKWVEFDAAVAARLEQRWKMPRPSGQQKGQVATDSERFVDLDALMQARKDNPTRVRGVVRIATAAELAQPRWMNGATQEAVATAGVRR